MSRLIRIWAPPSSPYWRETQLFTRDTNKVRPAPTAMLPKATQRKLSVASWTEKAPVSAAAIAKRRQTRPKVSFSRDSPYNMCIIRLGIGARWAMADTAMGSVGERTAARAKATASDTAGIIQWMRRPMPITVNMTRPSANSTTVLPSLNSSSRGICPHRGRAKVAGRGGRISPDPALPANRRQVRSAPRALSETVGAGVAGVSCGRECRSG